jgi:hypothetical protein
MSRSTFSGPVRSLGGFYTQGPGAVINLPNGTDTLTLDPELHAGRVIRANDATLTLTLPTIGALSGESDDPNTQTNVGVNFTVFVETTVTNLKIATDGTDKFVGSLTTALSAGAGTLFVPAASNDNINLNGTTSGGIAGSFVSITAIAPLKWAVDGVLIGSGTLVTPFADA